MHALRFTPHASGAQRWFTHFHMFHIDVILWQLLGATSFGLLYWVVLVLYRMSPMVLVQLFGHLNVKYIRQHYKYDIVDAFTHSYCCICYIATYRYKYPTISSYVMPLAWFVRDAVWLCMLVLVMVIYLPFLFLHSLGLFLCLKYGFFSHFSHLKSAHTNFFFTSILADYLSNY